MLAQTKIIETPHGNLETPAFFPVHHINKRGSASFPKYWNEIPELQTMLVNANGIKESERFKKILNNGLAEHFHFKGTYFVDSGGLQSRLKNFELDPLDILRIQESGRRLSALSRKFQKSQVDLILKSAPQPKSSGTL